MKVELIINNVKFEIGYDSVRMLAFHLDDCPENCDIAHELAKDLCHKTRTYIASRCNLYPETIALLMHDKNRYVIDSMLRNIKFLYKMTKEDVDRFIDIEGPNVMVKIMKQFKDLKGYYNVCERNRFIDIFAHHTDPNVRRKLAEDTKATKEILDKITQDPDCDVARAAKLKLNNIDASFDVRYDPDYDDDDLDDDDDDDI